MVAGAADDQLLVRFGGTRSMLATCLAPVRPVINESFCACDIG
jgi:hypothetical protein